MFCKIPESYIILTNPSNPIYYHCYLSSGETHFNDSLISFRLRIPWNSNKGSTIIVDHCLYAGVGACRLQVYWGRSAEVSCPSTMPSTWTRRGRLRKFDDVGGEGPPAPAGKITGKEVVRSEGTIFSSAVEAGQPPSPKIGSGKSSE